MHKHLSLTVAVLALGAVPLLAQEATAPANQAGQATQPASEAPAVQAPATEGTAASGGTTTNAIVVQQGSGTGGLAQARTRLDQVVQQLQQSTQENVGQVTQDAGSALDELEQAVQGDAQTGTQEQRDQIQQQIDDARSQLQSDPQQAALTMQSLSASLGEMETVVPQADIPSDADQIIGKQLVSNDGEEVGEISNVLVTAEGQVEALVIDQGGALGLGGRQVTITWDQVEIQGDQMMVNMASDEVEQLPDYVTE